MTQFRSAHGWLCRTCGEFVEDSISSLESELKDMLCDNCNDDEINLCPHMWETSENIKTKEKTIRCTICGCDGCEE